MPKCFSPYRSWENLPYIENETYNFDPRKTHLGHHAKEICLRAIGTKATQVGRSKDPFQSNKDRWLYTYNFQIN